MTTRNDSTIVLEYNPPYLSGIELEKRPIIQDLYITFSKDGSVSVITYIRKIRVEYNFSFNFLLSSPCNCCLLIKILSLLIEENINPLVKNFAQEAINRYVNHKHDERFLPFDFICYRLQNIGGKLQRTEDFI